MQFVLHDHLDIRFPHVMLFARENIPPLTELTFDYGSVPSSYSEESGKRRVLARENIPPLIELTFDYGYVPSSYSEESGKCRVLAKVEMVPEPNRSYNYRHD
jgi:hypothetical protein